MDIRNYSRQFITEFIELYRDLPCLWKVKSKDYSNRDRRNNAYELLITKLKEIEPDADKDMVIKKINSLRTAFRRELKKVRESQHSGAGSDDLYEPHLWYFSLLLFTSDQEVPRDGKCNLGEDNLEISRVEDTEENHEISNKETEPKVTATSNNTGSKKRKAQPASNNVLHLAYKALSESEDAFDSFGKTVAHQLRNMNGNQQIFAKKIINEALFFGEMEQLSLDAAMQFGTFMQNIKSQTCSSTAVSSYPSTPTYSDFATQSISSTPMPNEDTQSVMWPL